MSVAAGSGAAAGACALAGAGNGRWNKSRVLNPFWAGVQRGSVPLGCTAGGSGLQGWALEL